MITIECPGSRPGLIHQVWAADWTNGPPAWVCGRCNLCGSLRETDTSLFAADPRALTPADQLRWARTLASLSAHHAVGGRA